MVRRPANAPPLEEAALRGSPTDRRPTPRPRRVRRAALAVAPGVLLLPLLGAAPPGSGPSAPTGLQGAFTAAATAGHRMLGSSVPGDFVAEVRERIRPGSSALLVLSEPLTKETVSTISAGDPHVTVLRADVAPSDEGTPAG